MVWHKGTIAVLLKTVFCIPGIFYCRDYSSDTFSSSSDEEKIKQKAITGNVLQICSSTECFRKFLYIF